MNRRRPCRSRPSQSNDEHQPEPQHSHRGHLEQRTRVDGRGRWWPCRKPIRSPGARHRPRRPCVGGPHRPAAGELRVSALDADMLHRRRLPAAGLQQVVDAQSVPSLIAAGFGVALVPQSIARFTTDEIVFRPIRPSPPSADVFLVFQKGRRVDGGTKFPQAGASFPPAEAKFRITCRQMIRWTGTRRARDNVVTFQGM